MKHKKKKNVGILFELLARQVVSSTLEGDKVGSRAASALTKKYFSRGTILYEELSLFNTLLYNQTDSHRVAEKILKTTLNYARSLDEKEINETKNNLICEISDCFDKNTFFKTKLTNYKTYASIQQLLDNTRQVQLVEALTDKIVLEEQVIDHLINNSEHQRINLYKETYERLPIDNLTNKIIQDKYNKKYSSSFGLNQRKLLSQFILNKEEAYTETAKEEVNSIKSILSEAIEKHEDPIQKVRLADAKQILEEVNVFELTENNLQVLLTYMDLAEDLSEVKQNAN